MVILSKGVKKTIVKPKVQSTRNKKSVPKKEVPENYLKKSSLRTHKTGIALKTKTVQEPKKIKEQPKILTALGYKRKMVKAREENKPFLNSAFLKH